MPEGIIYQPGDSRSEGLGNLVPEVFESVYVYFRLPDALVDPVNPRVRISQAGVNLTIRTLAPLVPPVPLEYSLTRLGTGYYKFIFYPINMPPGLYDIAFMGEDPNPTPNYGTLLVTGSFLMGLVPPEMNLIRALRHKLQDLNPALYTIIDNTKTVWTDENLLSYILETMNEVNQTPSPSNYTVANFPACSMILDGAYVRALQAAAVLEIWNTMQYSDEISFVIDRAPKLQALAAAVEARYNANRERWKMWWSLYGDDGSAGTGQWMGETKLPFQIARVLSWLPNMQNTFGI